MSGCPLSEGMSEVWAISVAEVEKIGLSRPVSEASFRTRVRILVRVRQSQSYLNRRRLADQLPLTLYLDEIFDL